MPRIGTKRTPGRKVCGHPAKYRCCCREDLDWHELPARDVVSQMRLNHDGRRGSDLSPLWKPD